MKNSIKGNPKRKSKKIIFIVFRDVLAVFLGRTWSNALCNVLLVGGFTLLVLWVVGIPFLLFLISSNHFYYIIGFLALSIFSIYPNLIDYIKEVKTGTKKCIKCGKFTKDVVCSGGGRGRLGPYCIECNSNLDSIDEHENAWKKAFLVVAVILIITIIIFVIALIFGDKIENFFVAYSNFINKK